jgi:hypothetical protein
MRRAFVVPALRIAVVLCAVAVSACDPPSSDAEEEERGVWVPQGKADSGDAATCLDACGDRAAAGCWCDDLCEYYDDCCPDKVDVCDCIPSSCEEQPEACGVVDDGCGGLLDCGTCPPAACEDPDESLDPPVEHLTAVGTLAPQDDPDQVQDVVLSLEGPGLSQCLETSQCFVRVDGELTNPEGHAYFRMDNFAVSHATYSYWARRAELSKYPWTDGRVSFMAKSEGGQCPGRQLHFTIEPGSTTAQGMYSYYTPLFGGCQWHRFVVEFELDGPTCVPAP